MADGGEWLRARGIGRERFASYVADYLSSIGFQVERTDAQEPSESRVVARLVRMNPAVPTSAKELRFLFVPTSGGAAAVLQYPSEIEPADKSRVDRMVRELVQHLERAVSTESHGTAKVTKAPTSRLPWESTGSALAGKSTG